MYQQVTYLLRLITIGLVVFALTGLSPSSTSPIAPASALLVGRALAATPVAVDDTDTTDEDNDVTTNVLANDTGLEDGGITVSVTVDPADGSATVNGDNTVTYNPDQDFFGSDSYTYEVCDNESDCDTANVSLTVNSVNDLPTITDIANQTINEDGNTGALPFTVGDVETAAGSLGVAGSSSNTTLVPNGNIVFGGSGANRTVTVTPAANQFGSANITITVTDGDMGSEIDAFQVTVNSVNDLPTITDIANQTINEDGNTGALPFTVGDVETAAGSLGVSGSSSNTTLVPLANIVFGGSGSSRTVTVTPAANQSGSATITVTVTDGNLETASDTFLLTVNPVNENPTISDIPDQITDEDTVEGPINFTVGDTDNDPNSLVLAGTSSNQTLVPDANIAFGGSGTSRTVTITPAANASGSATITVTVDDGQGGTAQDTFLLTVNPVNDPPVAVDDPAYATPEDTQLVVAVPGVLGNDSDIEGTSLTAIKLTNPTLGSVTLNANGSFTYTPNPNASGVDTFTYQAHDGLLPSNTATVTITVGSSNDPPTITDIADQVIDEDGTTGVLPFTVGDVETPATSLAVTGASSNTTLVPNLNILFGGSGTSRTVTVIPAANQSGTATITINVTDADLGTTFDDFLVTVNAANDNPTISNITDKTIDEDGSTGAIAFTIGDLESPAGDLVASGTSSNQTLVPDGNILFTGSGANRIVTVTPAPNQNGTATITVTITDPQGSSGSDTFLLTVNPMNDLPSNIALSETTVPEMQPAGALVGTLTTTDIDGGPIYTYSLVAGTGDTDNASFTIVGNSLLTGAVFDFETKPSYSVRIQTDDGNGGTFQKEFTITVEDVAGATITVDPIVGLLTTEAGGSDTFTVVLDVKPSANVTLGLSSSDPTEGSVSPVSLTFTPANWDTLRTVTVTGLDDLSADGPIEYQILTAAATSADPDYQGIDPDDVEVVNGDNDTAGWTVSPPDRDTTEGGIEAKIKIALNTEPKADVVITFNSTDISEGTVPDGPLVITPANWNTQEHTIKVTGVDDTLTDGNRTFAIRIFAASDDDDYDGLRAMVSVKNKDAPTIVWELPTTDGKIFDIFDNTPVLLRVKQVGNEPIEMVRFYRFDWELGEDIIIGEDATPPYQIYLYPADLPEPIPENINSPFNFVYAHASDESDPPVLSLRKHIWIYRQGTNYVLYLPLVLHNYP